MGGLGQRRLAFSPAPGPLFMTHGPCGQRSSAASVQGPCLGCRGHAETTQTSNLFQVAAAESQLTWPTGKKPSHPLPSKGNAWCWRPGETQLPGCFSPGRARGDQAGLGLCLWPRSRRNLISDRCPLALPSVCHHPWQRPRVSSCSQPRSRAEAAARDSLKVLKLFGRPNPAVLRFSCESASWGPLSGQSGEPLSR